MFENETVDIKCTDSQNIDANFSKIQQIMANRILPAVKRYAVSTEPVREAAKVCNHALAASSVVLLKLPFFQSCVIVLDDIL